MKTHDVAIIGAGPSGIMAAIIAARDHRSVVLIDKNYQIGRKILATGNGRCNLTNKYLAKENYYGSDIDFLWKVIKQFNEKRTIDFFQNLGVVIKEEEAGRIFPRTNQASTVLAALTHELIRLNVKILTEHEVKDIVKKTNWEIQFTNEPPITSHKLIIATGGKAAHQLGSSGDGIYFAKKFGHKVYTLYPSLVPVETQEDWVQSVQGLKIDANVEFTIGREIISQRQGDLLFTHYGLSGPAIMGQARFIAPFIGQKEITINIDIFPEGDVKKLDQLLTKIIDSNGAKSIRNALSGLIPASLSELILQLLSIDGHRKAAQVSKEDRQRIVKCLKKLSLHVKSLRPFKEAQVSRGGVDLHELTKNLESKLVPDLYFCGEVLDVDADSGGFNLQWAWSSGYVVGHSV